MRLIPRALTLCTLFVSACGGSDMPTDAGTPPTDAGPSPTDASARDARTDDAGLTTGVRITAAAGGDVTSEDGLFTIHVFPGGLAEDTTISITRVPDADVPADVRAMSPIGAVYSAEPDGLTFIGDGAYGWFHFETIPAGLVEPGSPPRFVGVAVSAKPRDGGAIDVQGDASAEYDATAGSLDVVARLAHLSLQFAHRDGLTLSIDFHEDVEHPVYDIWDGDHFTVAAPLVRTFGETAQPLSELALWPGATAPVEIRVRDLAGMVVEDRLVREGAGWVLRPQPRVRVPLPSGSADPVTVSLPPAELRCLGPTAAPVSVRFTMQASYRGWQALVGVAADVECATVPATEISILDTLHAEREQALVSVGFEPQVQAEVHDRASATTTALGTTPWIARSTPAAATPAPGPTTIVATNGAATVTADRDATSGSYTTSIDNPTAFDASSTTQFRVGAELIDVAGTSAPDVEIGDVAGLDTTVRDLIADSATLLRIRFADPLRCGTDDVRDVEIWRSLDGTDPVAIREGIDALAAHCSRTVTELTAGDFTIDLETHSSATLDPTGTPLRVTTGHRTSIDGQDLLATCPGTRQYCTDRCVNLATDPLNCGGCGVMPTEICNGLDDDCDTSVDEGCPRFILWPSSDTSFGPILGTTGGSFNTSMSCAYPTVTVGVCVNVDASGSIRSIRGRCSGTRLLTDTSAIPYRYSIGTTPSGTPGDGCGIGGGSSGGMVMEHTCGPSEFIDTVVGQAGTDMGQIAFRCARWEIQELGGVWSIVRTTTSMSPTFGTGTGSAFGPWTVENDRTTDFPGGLRYMYISFGSGGLPGNVKYVQPQGASPYLRYGP